MKIFFLCRKITTVIFFVPRQCPSKTFGGFDTTKDLPDEVVTFARSHPAMFNPVYPINNKPIIVKTDVDYQFTQIVVDKVEAEDGQYDVMFIGTGNRSNFMTMIYDKQVLYSRYCINSRHVCYHRFRHGDNSESSIHSQRLLA